MLDWYNIQGARTTDPANIVAFETKLVPKPFQVYFDELIIKLDAVFKNKKPFSLLRVGDAEWWFLTNKFVGNIITRHRTNKLPIRSEEWLQALLANDLVTYNVEPRTESPESQLSAQYIAEPFPTQVVYACIASRQLFQLLAKHDLKVGLIGNQYKLEVIQLLMEVPEYREYLGLGEFVEYIPVPQTGTANDPEVLLGHIMHNVSGRADVYLVGMGIGKLKVLSQLRDKTGKIILDIGCGVDAIAGGVCHERPYFADWVNYRLEGFSYFHIDQLDLYAYDHANYNFRFVRPRRNFWWLWVQNIQSLLSIFNGNYRWKKWRKYVDTTVILRKLRALFLGLK